MDQPPGPIRLLTFLSVSLGLLLTAVFFSRGGDSGIGEATERRPPSSASAPARTIEERASTDPLRSAAKRFLVAFLAYGGGEEGVDVRRALRASATAEFARDLLRSSSSRAGRALQPAHLRKLVIATVSAQPPLALVSGSAQRRDGAEEFSFLFTHRGGRWLTSGPAQ